MEKKSVQSIDRALDIIEILSTERDGLGVTEIGVRLGLHKSTVHRLLNVLLSRGYMEKDIKQGNYKLGMKFIEVSSLFLNNIELKTEAQPYLRKLAGVMQQPVHLAILDGKEVIYIEKVEALHTLRMYSMIGRRVPAYCSAIGKVLLSGMEDEELHSLLEDMKIQKHTSKTITDKKQLLDAILQVRESGYAIDNEEHEEGVRCIAAPVYDFTGRIIASVSTSGSCGNMSEERYEEISGLVKETAGNISQRMGYVRNNDIP